MAKIELFVVALILMIASTPGVNAAHAVTTCEDQRYTPAVIVKPEEPSVKVDGEYTLTGAGNCGGAVVTDADYAVTWAIDCIMTCPGDEWRELILTVYDCATFTNDCLSGLPGVVVECRDKLIYNNVLCVGDIQLPDVIPPP